MQRERERERDRRFNSALFSGRTHSVTLVSQSESTAAECHRSDISIYLLTHLLFHLSAALPDLLT